jgi:hypothetical protein
MPNFFILATTTTGLQAKEMAKEMWNLKQIIT